MEYSKIESAIVESIAMEAELSQVRDLNDLQLALIAGGSGDTIAF